jgi:hypothetical protein
VTLLSPFTSGDANGDGFVDRADVAILARSLGRADDVLWSHGDFDNNHRVDLADAALLQSHLGQGPAPSAAVIPEPSSLVLAGVPIVLVALRQRSRRGRQSRALAAVCTHVAVLFASAVAYSADLRTVALSGQQVPGTSHSVICRAFGVPVLNDAGQTMFEACVTGTDVVGGNNEGIWAEGLGSLAPVAREGIATSDASGLNFIRFASMPDLLARG